MSKSGGAWREQIKQTRRAITLKNGTEWTIQDVPPLFLERYTAELAKGEPKAPVQEVKLAGGKKSLQANPNDPDHLEKLATWRRNRSLEAMKFILVMGVVIDVPEDFRAEFLEEFPDYTEGDWKYLWITVLLPDEESISELSSAIVGQTEPTEEGVTEAMEEFRNSD